MNKRMRMRRERVVWFAALTAVFLLVNGLLCFLHYRQYRQKLELVYQAAAAEGTVSWAVGVLRDGVKEEQSVQVPPALRQYGYDGNYRGAFGRDYVQNCIFSVAGSSILFFFFLLFTCRCAHWTRRGRQAEREELQMLLSLLRKGDYAQVRRHSGLDELGLSSLAEQMELVTEEAALEKEETKTLVTDISHQLKTPLAALSASLDILKREELTPAEQKEFVERCRCQLARLSELASALLAISRMETGMIEINPVRAPLFDTLLVAVNRIYPKADEKHMEIVLEENGEAEQTFLMQDVRWLSEAFINILENAVKYSEPYGSIAIGVERLQTFVRIEFADEGIGIPREERNRVFMRFYRGGDQRVRRENGSGVGLYLTRKIVEQHYGTIRVKAASGGRGSVFVVQIPYVRTGGVGQNDQGEGRL